MEVLTYFPPYLKSMQNIITHATRSITIVCWSVQNLGRKRKVEKKGNNQSCSRRSISESSHSMGELLCCFCLKKDELQHLVAAGTLHATENKADPSHVQNITEKWRSMAAVINNEELLRKLAFDDVTSNFFTTKTVMKHLEMRKAKRDTKEWTKASVLVKLFHIFTRPKKKYLLLCSMPSVWRLCISSY